MKRFPNERRLAAGTDLKGDRRIEHMSSQTGTLALSTHSDSPAADWAGIVGKHYLKIKLLCAFFIRLYILKNAMYPADKRISE